jgi:hypothetical protein
MIGSGKCHWDVQAALRLAEGCSSAVPLLCMIQKHNHLPDACFSIANPITVHAEFDLPGMAIVYIQWPLQIVLCRASNYSEGAGIRCIWGRVVDPEPQDGHGHKARTIGTS